MEASECQGKNGLMMLGNIQKRTLPSRLLFGNRETGQRWSKAWLPLSCGPGGHRGHGGPWRPPG